MAWLASFAGNSCWSAAAEPAIKKRNETEARRVFFIETPNDWNAGLEYQGFHVGALTLA
jgi:hypothetical protein